MTRKRRRLYFVVLGLLGLASGIGLVLTAFQDNITFFKSPTEIAAEKPKTTQRLNVGGLVEDGSVQKNGKAVSFSVTDLTESLKIQYVGILPDLFREGQGVVAVGHLGADGVFLADEIMAKHDEKYMPREVADALKKSGRWNEGTGKIEHPATQAATPAPTTPQ